MVLRLTELCLVRHGQTDWNYNHIIQGREDIPLNEKGRQQAAESAAFLSQETWDVIVSSPLSRAFDTAAQIALACGMDVEKIIRDERFIEREFGESSGKPVADMYEHVQRDDVHAVPRLESEEQIKRRVFEGLQDLATRYEGKRIIVVCHSHAIKAALSAIDSSYTFRHPLKNACSNYIVHVADRFEIRAVNVADHISDTSLKK